MNNALRKDVFQTPIITRDGKKLPPNPAEGGHIAQVGCASALVFARYQKAFERLSKM